MTTHQQRRLADFVARILVLRREALGATMAEERCGLDEISRVRPDMTMDAAHDAALASLGLRHAALARDAARAAAEAAHQRAEVQRRDVGRALVTEQVLAAAARRQRR